jgi:hypothetical protein
VVSVSPRAPEPIAAEPPAPEPAPVAVRPAPSRRPSGADSLASAVHVQRTLWHPMPARRTALVAAADGEHELREGDKLGALTVEKIEPSGVVFSYAGREVRRGVGD